MKKQNRVLIILVMMLFLAGGVAFWLLQRQNPVEPSVQKAVATTSTPATMGVASAVSPSASPLPASAQQQSKLKDGKGFSLLPSLSAAKIEFYGKVIDQNNKPLPGVDVTGRTGSKTGFMQEETRTYTTTTGGDGLFSFSGFKGDGLVIDLKKAGYNFESSDRQFLYSPIDPDHKRFTPDQNNPVVFQMWKNIGAEPMIHYIRSLGHIPVDRMPIHIDLIRGTVVQSGGDFEIIAKMGMERAHNHQDRDWSVAFSVPNGGLLEGGGNVNFQAPLEGYQPSVEYSFTAEQKQVELKKRFYFVSRNQKLYGRIEVEIYPGSDVKVVLSAWLNPNGSRNLEYDPNKQAPAQ